MTILPTHPLNQQKAAYKYDFVALMTPEDAFMHSFNGSFGELAPPWKIIGRATPPAEPFSLCATQKFCGCGQWPRLSPSGATGPGYRRRLQSTPPNQIVSPVAKAGTIS